MLIQNLTNGFTFTGSQTLAQKLAALRAQNPNAGLPYYEVGDTAYVTFDQFIATADGNNLADYYKLVKEGKDLPQDTIGIIHEAHKQITRENSPIKNVVMDLSLNGGGSCVVGFATTAWGTSYRYSSPKRLSFVKNGAYYDVDQGVEPDHVIDNYANFYDRDALTEFIHGLY